MYPKVWVSTKYWTYLVDFQAEVIFKIKRVSLAIDIIIHFENNLY